VTEAVYEPGNRDLSGPSRRSILAKNRGATLRALDAMTGTKEVGLPAVRHPVGHTVDGKGAGCFPAIWRQFFRARRPKPASFYGASDRRNYLRQPRNLHQRRQAVRTMRCRSSLLVFSESMSIRD